MQTTTDEPDAESTVLPSSKAKKGDKKVSKTKQKELLRLEAQRSAFSRFFAALYADQEGRWARLLAALESPVRFACVINKYANPDDVMRALNPVEGLLQIVDLQPGLRCVTLDESNRDPRPFPPPKMDMGGVKTHYLMDLASVVATEGLDLQPGDTVLDMCAAPGGKSFCMLQRLGPRRRLIANEMSNDRRTRLRKVLKEYIPTQILTTCIETTGFDGTKKDSFPRNTYPKILCDAPCSSERHVLHDDAELGQWSAGRTKASAKRQVQLLGNALRAALDEGGRVVYATCSISKHENDLVVQKVIKKSPFKVKVRTHDRAWMVGEATEVGWIVLPDTPGRWGPLYFAVLEKDGYKEDGKEDDGLDDMDDMDD